jgi:hypothetical protein
VFTRQNGGGVVWREKRRFGGLDSQTTRDAGGEEFA